jgi:hypothetical protein
LLRSRQLTSRRWLQWTFTAVLLSASFASALGAVRLLSPGDAMMPLASFPQSKLGSATADKAPKLDTIRVAVSGGDASLLADITPQAAPFQVVAPADGADLVWDAGSRQAVSKGEIIAYDVGPPDLAAVIDRMALVEALSKLAEARPQPISIASGGPVRRKGDKIEVELADMLHRALILFVVSGDGLVQALYPIAADSRIIETPAFVWNFEVEEPFGTDLIVAISAAQPMDALEDGLRRLSHYRSAGEVLGLLALTVPPDARIGVAALQSAP